MCSSEFGESLAEGEQGGASLVTDPTNELGQTGNRWWTDVPPPGQIFFYRITSP